MIYFDILATRTKKNIHLCVDIFLCYNQTMKISPTLRAILSVLLIITGLIALLGTYKYASYFLYSTFDVRNMYLLAAAVGGLTVSAFALITVAALIGRKPLSKEAYVIGIIFSIISIIILLYFGFGIIKDILGVYCSGFFGVQSSCTQSPMLVLYIIVLHPFALAAAGLLSVFGIVKQLTLSKSKL